MQSEIKRRNDRETAAADFTELAQTKGISRSVFQRMLDSVHGQRRMDDIAAIIRNRLIQEGGNVRHHGRISDEVRSYFAKRLDGTNSVIFDGAERIVTELSLLPDQMFSSPTAISDIISVGRQTPTVHLALTGTWPRRCGRRRTRGFCRSTPKSTSCCSIGPAGRSVRTSAGQSRAGSDPRPARARSIELGEDGARIRPDVQASGRSREFARAGGAALLATVVSGKDGGPSRFCLRMRIDATRRPI